LLHQIEWMRSRPLIEIERRVRRGPASRAEILVGSMTSCKVVRGHFAEPICLIS